MPDSPVEITQLLERLQNGDRKAQDSLYSAVYSELRRIASRYMARERADHTLQTTALVNEAYLRLLGGQQIEWQSRAHFFAMAATVMRRILVDHARERASRKQGGAWVKLELEDALAVSDDRLEEILAIDQLVSRLEQMDPRMGRAVEMRFFGGLKENEIAEALNVSVRTVKRDWRTARAWMRSELNHSSD